MRWQDEPDIQDWLQGCRLRWVQGMHDYLDDPGMLDALERIDEHRQSALSDLERLRERVESTTD